MSTRQVPPFRWAIGKFATFLLVGTLFLLITTAILSLSLFHAFDQRIRSMLRSYATVSQLNELRSLLVDIETGTRGYLITGDKSYLEPFRTGDKLTGDAIAQLRHIGDERPAQKDQLVALENLTAKKLAIAKKLIEEREKKWDQSRSSVEETTG
ncbi:MAG: hypothetical protein KatS3mg105_3765 [Gemmatales bacterium]|nr:MAG: hypothetical protein KatS3mg105_3765 [Gemmatales bacterium]